MVSASAAGFTGGSDTVTVLDDDTATIRFAAPGSLAAEAAGTHAIAVQIEIPGGGMLEHDVSVDVVDSLSGTATASGLSK